MSLATRCPACGTIFRVVQDQLKVSEGWVRCGQCHEVFHGIEALFDLDSDPAIAARRAARGPAPQAAPSMRDFAENRANAPIPTPEPPAGIVVPSPPPSPSAPTPTSRTMPWAPSAIEPRAPVPQPTATGVPDGFATPPSGFTPTGGATPPTSTPPSPIARPTMAPRFAARFAEEAARAQAAQSPSPIPSAFPDNAPASWQSPDLAPPPSAGNSPEPMPNAWQPSPPAQVPEPSPTTWSSPAAWPPPASEPTASPAPVAWPAQTSAFEPQPPAPQAWDLASPSSAPMPAAPPPPTIWESPAGAPPPLRPSFNAPTEAMPLDGLGQRGFEPPTAPRGFAPTMPASASDIRAAELAETFAAAPEPEPEPAAPPARQPRTIMPKAIDDSVVEQAPVVVRTARAAKKPVPDIGGSTLPSMLADDAADDDRAGPPTLASMLPEDAGEWPPRRKSRKAARAAADAAKNEGKLESQIAMPRRSDPRFLREARSDARWRQPWVRAVLGVSLVVLVFGAVGQIAWPERDLLAARWPDTMPAWNWLCAQADCRIEPPRGIASLALDGSSLNRTDTDHVLLFSADLHNRADHAVRMPSFDLTFMDINGAIVSRKVLSPEQIGIRQAALAPEAELHVHARIQVGTLDASGFQAEMFYP